jgi:nucleotide-binding universal stress UspA family protein
MEASRTSMTESGASWVRTVVVAADGSPASVQGLEQAADLASRLGSRVLVVFVRHVPTAALMASGITTPSVVESLNDLESEVRQQAIHILGGSGVSWDFVVGSGMAGQEVVRIATEADADLIVVGSNRHSSLHNLLLGSTAAYLTAHSPVPVLVMRALVPAHLATAR